jgi:hypothetical protein
MYNQQLQEMLGEVEKERRMSVLSIREKQQLVEKLEEKNRQIAEKMEDENKQFKKKAGEFFNKNQDLDRLLQENGRKSDMMAK